MSQLPRRVSVLFCLLLLWIAAPLRADDSQVDFERWYVVMLAGQRVGSMHSLERTDGDHIVTEQAMSLALRRGPSTVQIEQSMQFTETADGRPVSAETTLKMAQNPLLSRYFFEPDGIRIERDLAGRTLTEHVPKLAGDYLTPAAAQHRIEQLDQQGADTINLAMLDVSTGQPNIVAVSMKRIGKDHVDVLGKTVPAQVWDVTSSATGAMTIRQYADDKGQMLRSTISIMGMTLDILAADQAMATADVDPPEVVADLMVQPDHAIADPRQLRSALYKLLLPADYHGQLPRGGYQRVTWADEHTALVAVDLDQPVAPTGDQATDEQRKPTGILDYQDDAVQSLLTQALGDQADTLSNAEKAEKLRAFVHRFVTDKNLSVGFASAGEVARTAEGDCTEHAVLLAALLRAAGIPSRTVTGLIYVDQFLGQHNAFGYHMWTQAWLSPTNETGDRWVDLDATLDDPFDAAHIALAVSNLQESALAADMMSLLPLLSHLRIEVLDPQ